MNLIRELWKQVDREVGEDEVVEPEEFLDVQVAQQINQLLSGQLDKEICDEIREFEAGLKEEQNEDLDFEEY